MREISAEVRKMGGKMSLRVGWTEKWVERGVQGWDVMKNGRKDSFKDDGVRK